MTAVATPEVVMIAKMEWRGWASRPGRSRMRLIYKMLRVRVRQVDWTYLEDWVRELKLEQQWDAVRKAAGVVTDHPPG